ncbi:MAG: hypothetical protein M3N16_07735 [Actinomycetota bacterium]|nr:hypothetical protein [Actinomycetota bacterium]
MDALDTFHEHHFRDASPGAVESAPRPAHERAALRNEHARGHGHWIAWEIRAGRWALLKPPGRLRDQPGYEPGARRDPFAAGTGWTAAGF